jgi:transketolase
MNDVIAMRDAFIEKLYDFAKQDRNVILVSADMGAPSLERYRRDLSSQYVNVGVAEQNMIMVAVGLTLAGKKVFTFSIGPFATARCFEFTKVDIILMNLPITIIGVGAGFSYDGDGPTHYATEDISIMRVLPQIQIYSPCDSIAAAACAHMAYKSSSPTYIRLDRQVVPEIYSTSESFEMGFKELNQGDDICIVATANMVHSALAISRQFEKKGSNIGVIDLYKLKPIGQEFKKVISKYKTIISLEEHLLDGGMGSIIAEIITDEHLPIILKRLGLNKYVYAYGRKNIQKLFGINEESIVNVIENLQRIGSE